MYMLACGAVAGCDCWAPLLAAIAGDWGGGVYTLADWTWCRCWLPLLGAIAGLPLLGCLAGCHCWVALPLLAAIARWHVVRCHGKVPLLGAMW